jgi:hypothetical protein
VHHLRGGGRLGIVREPKVDASERPLVLVLEEVAVGAVLEQVALPGADVALAPVEVEDLSLLDILG